MSLLSRVVGILSGKDRVRAAKLVAAGVACARDGDLAQALRLYQRAVRADASYALAHLNVGLALQDQYNREHTGLDEAARHERLAAIAEVLDQACALDPTLAPACSARGYVWQALGRDREALVDLERFLELAPDADRLRATVQHDIEILRDRIDRRDRRERAVQAVQDAATASEALHEACALIEAAIQDTPDDRELWWALGVGRRRLGDAAQAVQAFARLAELDPDDALAPRELSSLAFKAGQIEVALRHARRAYELQPTDAGVVCNLGVCHLKIGDLARAREFIELARELDPADPIVQDCLRELERAAGPAATEAP